MRLTRALAAALVAATGVLLPLGAAPAYAAGCASASGVSVVVDKATLGGGIAEVCDDAGGGRTAAAIFGEAGFPLTYVATEPGFVCRVSGAPTSDPCQQTPPADAYWGLWWTDGSSPTWRYSTLGVTSLRVPAGGSVAFAFDDGDKSPPGVPAPVQSAGSSAGGSGGGAGGSPGGSGGGSGGPSGDSGGSGGSGGTASPPVVPSTPASPSTTVPPSSAPSASATTGGGTGTSGRGGDARSGHRADPGVRTDGKDRGDTVSGRRRDRAAGAPGSTPPSAAEESAAQSAQVQDVPFEQSVAPATEALPTWVAPGVIALLVLVGAGVGLLRRRRGAATRP